MNVAAFRLVATSAVAANAGRHVLTHVRGEEVGLIGRRAGIHFGSIVTALGALIAVRRGLSAVGLGEPVGRRLCSACIPVCLLVDLVAGVDVNVCAFSLVGRVEVDARTVADVAGVSAVSAIAGAVSPVEIPLSEIASDGNDPFDM